MDPDPNLGLNQAPDTPAPVISAVELTRVFGSGETAVSAVSGVSLEVRSGEFLAVTGRSGSGKTTFLNLLSGLDQPTQGLVRFQGRDLAEYSDGEMVELRRNKLGFVFQSFGLMPLLSAMENVELPLHISGASWRERRRRALESLELVGLGSRSRHRPYELSGGEQQRVSIARALVTGPDVIFADEPTGELDTTTAMSICSLLGEIVAQRGTTVLVATHDLALAGMCSRRVDLADGAVLSDV
ncbi:MAG: macrolide ABC transporter ATP-binding protein [SAR202 cluster bacterium Io17-Chloro-G9]|nr:MAG: macrolide ABC transporter ATP-binding protein [SAR202 cluster bacterium Io17-Chloro-G9]